MKAKLIFSSKFKVKTLRISFLIKQVLIDGSHKEDKAIEIKNSLPPGHRM